MHIFEVEVEDVVGARVVLLGEWVCVSGGGDGDYGYACDLFEWL